MKLYELHCDAETVVFCTLAEARRYRVDNKIKRYRLDKIETPRITQQLLCDIINSHGGSYCLERETIFNNLY